MKKNTEKNAKKKILIVEDEELLIKALAAGFPKDEYVVFTAKDGVEGYDMAMKERPHLILLDLLMPRMDGISMLKKLRLEDGEWGKDVKIIILTNLEDKDKIAAAVENRVYDYMVKSNWNLADVVKKVQTELKYIE